MTRRGSNWSDDDDDESAKIDTIGSISQLNEKPGKAPKRRIGFYTPPVDLTCPTHMDYDGSKKPRSKCAACRRLYNALNG